MSSLRDRSPLGKFLMLLALMASAYATDSLLIIAALIAVQFIVAMKEGLGRLFKTTILALSVGALTLTLFQVFSIGDGRVLFALSPSGEWGRVTDEGLRASLYMSGRMMASIGAIPLFVALTPATQIVSLVSGTFRLPASFTFVLVTALRFIPTFGERMGLVMQAEACRGYRVDGANPIRKIGMVLRLSLPLLVTCVRDVETLALSLESRGFDPSSKVRPESMPLSGAEALAAAAGFGLAGLLFALRVAAR